MYSNDVINTFIELRSEGQSYRQIADHLKISIGLASLWATKHEAEIKQLAAVRKEALFQRYSASYEGKLADLANELKRIDEELKQRDFECVSTEFLLYRKTCLQTRMEKLSVDPDLKPSNQLPHEQNLRSSPAVSQSPAPYTGSPKGSSGVSGVASETAAVNIPEQN